MSHSNRIQFILLVLLFSVILLFLVILDNKNSYIEIMEDNLNSTMDLLVDSQNDTSLLYDELNAVLDENAKLSKIDTSSPSYLIYLACKEYDVDYKLAYSIARLETGNFTSDVYKHYNNFGGMIGEHSYMSFDSRIEGVNAFVRMLKKYYINYGLDTPEKMQPKYCPDNSSWATKIRQIMKEIKDEY